jgi:hypothetical protein
VHATGDSAAGHNSKSSVVSRQRQCTIADAE